MKLLVTGGSGFVGWAFVQRANSRGHQVTLTYRSSAMTYESGDAVQLSLPDGRQVEELCSSVQPDVVVHAGAMTDVDECEREPETARAVNVEGTRQIVDGCEKVGADLVFFSTGFVFPGSVGERYTEADEREAVNTYGRTKIEAEDAVQNASVPHLICRIDQPFGWEAPWQQQTFVSWVLDQCEQGMEFPVFDNWYNTPVYIPDCTEAVLALLERGHTGTYHVAGSDFLSRYEWARAIARRFDYDPRMIDHGHSEDADLPAQRPNTHLDTQKILGDIDCALRSIDSALASMVENQ